MKAVKREECSDSNCKILCLAFVLVFLLDWRSRRREMALRCKVRKTNSLRIALNSKEDGRY